jgi:translocation and assembly module TamB
MSDHATQTPPPQPASPLQSSTPTTKRRGRRWLKVLVALVIVMVFGVAAAPTIIAKTALRNRLVRHAAADLNGSLEIGAASLGWFSPIELRDVTLRDSHGQIVATVPRITSSRTLLGFIRDRTTLGVLTLDRPSVEVVCDAKSSNIEDTFRKFLEDDGVARGPTRPALEVRVTGGTIALRDATTGAGGAFRNVDATIAIPSARAEPVAVKLTANAPGKLDADLTLGESGRVKLVAEKCALESLSPVLRRFSVDATLAGMLSADMTVSWDKASAALEGSLGGKNLALSGGWLNGDTLRLSSVQLPIKGSLTGRAFRIDRAELATNVGSLSVTGSFNPDEPLEKLLERPGTKLFADIDLAKLAVALPKSLRIRDRTEIREGKLVVRLESRAATDGTDWTGKIDTTALRAARDGNEIRWDDPLAVEFIGRYKPGQLPTFDKLICRSDFIALQAEVRPNSIRAAANIHLDRLTAHLADFIDLDGATFDGRGSAVLVAQREPDGSFKAEGSVDLKQFSFTDRAGKGMREPQIAIRISGAGRAPEGGPVAVSTGRATLTAGADELDLTLVDPIADARKFDSGTLNARLVGDLGRWWTRAGALVRLPHYVLGGAATARGRVRFTPETVAVDRLTLNVVNARFRGAGLDLDEPQMDAAAEFTFDTKAMTATFDRFALNSAPLSVTNGRLVVQAPAKGDVVVEGNGAAVVGLGRLGKTLKLYTDPRGPKSIHGRGTGPIRFRYTGDVTTFGGALDVVSFSVGLPTAPDWTEPALRLEAEGSYTESTDTLALATARIERPGLAASAVVTLGKVATVAELNVNGTVIYDLATLAPKLREQLGGEFSGQGRGNTPVVLTGSLNPPVKPGTNTRPGSLAAMNGEIRIGWDSMKTYGFEIGRSELHGKLTSGVGRVNPIIATFGGGKVHLQPTLYLDVEPGYLTFAKGKIVERSRLTPAVCAEALGYALPAIARSSQAEGEISMTLGENRIPIADSNRSLVKGQITIHRATVAPGPVIGEIAKLLGVGTLAMTIPNETIVPIRVENGLVHHQNFSVLIGGHTISTSGSVGFDGKLNLVADVPIPAGLLKNSPLAAKALVNKRVKVPITGTLSQPALDPRQLQASIANLAQDAMKDIGKELLNKELEKLFPGMPRPKK